MSMKTLNRTVQLEEDELPYRKGSSATIRSEGTGTQYYAKRGILPSYDGEEPMRGSRPVSTASNSSMRVRRLSSLTDDNTRFPKLQDCAHFHYDIVDINSLKVCLCDEDQEQYHHSSDHSKHFYLKISSNNRIWLARRTLKNFRMLDTKLHRCIFDRKFSHLPDLASIEKENISDQELTELVRDYLNRFSSLAGSMLNCGSVLNWLEIDNRGNRLMAVDDSGINTPAIAAAHAIKRYTAQAVDEISLEVGDIISVIDMPPTDDTIWWRGKRGFEVGFFPYECVEVIGDKVPQAVVSGVPETPQNRALLKKHGKFISFLRLFFNTRPERIQLKQSGIVKERVFGCDLGEHLLNSGHDVPLVLKSCAEVIESHGLVDGIYRLSGITSNIQKLRLAFDEDRVPDLTSEEYLQDVHSISSLLKMYFRELPNPLLTYQLYDKFANAVKDEENKLLRIHDVVQQLPPPHYRTTEYLMRHLARVAAHSHETGMHCKNLAIVWAPNLLRSKELETGGGAAALQGVGIQAVVTEFLIVYADILFSDKMPSYSSPELRKTQKKPRPKSLAISTPTRLLSLEEARERALLGSFVKPDQRYIDVGGGPQNLPSKYHTVIDLPGYKKKGSKDKGKKSPGGLKSLFTKSRTGSVRSKGRKPGSIHESLNFDIGDRKAITEEDVQHWKRRRLRSAKSAESLLSLPITSRLGSPLSESLDPNRLMIILAGKQDGSPTKKYSRSVSVESPKSLINSGDYSYSYPSFVLDDDSDCREMAIDVNPKDIELDFSKENEPQSDREKSESPDGVRRKQSFIRDDKKRRVICHRRVPSAPTTPRYDQRSSCEDSSDYEMADKCTSQPALESRPFTGVGSARNVSSGRKMSGESEHFYVHRIMSPNVVDNSNERLLEDNGAEKRKGSKTPPKDRKKLKEAKDKSPSFDGIHSDAQDGSRFRRASEPEMHVGDSKGSKTEIIKELPESPGTRRKLWGSSPSKSEQLIPSSSKTEEQTSKSKYKVVRRNHDYAEIDESKMIEMVEARTNLSSSSDTNIDSAHHYRVESINSVKSESQKDASASNRVLETDFPAESSVEDLNSDESARERTSDLLTEITKLEQGLQSFPKSKAGKSMTKCVSIPSDIQKSLENIRSHSGSHSDITSSLTISELSVSQDNVFSGNGSDSNGLHGERRRRSTSLDGLNDESPMSRTLKEINAQIDQAFKSEKHKAQTLKEMQAAHRACMNKQSSFESETMPYDDELNVTPTGHRRFGSMRDTDAHSPVSRRSNTSVNSETADHQKDPMQDHGNQYVERPKSEIHIVDAPDVIKAPVRHSNQAMEVPVTMTTPTRPSPPQSLDIVSSTSPTKQPHVLQSALSDPSMTETSNKNKVVSPDHSPFSNVPPAKTGFRMSEEDFQRILMADPDSLKQLEQSMMYSPVRARSKAFPDDRSARSSLASPMEGIIPRPRSNRSSLASPDASPGTFRSQVHNRSFGSPETSPLTGRPPRNQGTASIEASPQSRQRQIQDQSLVPVESSPKSGTRQKSKLPVPSSTEASPTSRGKHNQSFSSSDGSPQPRQKQTPNQSFSSVEGSPRSGRQTLNQSFSSVEASPPSRQKKQTSLSSSDSSPHSRQRLNQSTSSSEPSPQSARSKLNQSHSSIEDSPQSARQKINQSFSSSEASPQSSSRHLGANYNQSSPQKDAKRYGHSPTSGRKSAESPQLDFKVLGKKEQRKGSSSVSSPLSPEHTQPRWEDLAGLNDSFSEINMAVFNDNWKKCLAPTGDSIRQSNTTSGSSEQLTPQNDYHEVSTGTDTVVLERPSIRRKANVNTAPVESKVEKVRNSNAEIETYDNVPEHEAFLIQKQQEKQLRQHQQKQQPQSQQQPTQPQQTPQQPAQQSQQQKQQHRNPRYVKHFTDDILVTQRRPVVTRSHTVPESASLPQSPISGRTGITSPTGILEHASSFESASTIAGHLYGVPFEGAFSDPSGIRKSNTTPALTRQTSFDSSYKKSVRVTSLGSSFEEADSEIRTSHSTSNIQGQGYQGSFVTMTANGRSLSDMTTGAGFRSSTRQSNQSSVLIRSESTQSADVAFSDVNQSNLADQSSSAQSSVGTLLPQMLEEMDVNESCLGIASHQNMSNEMKEMMQEQMKEHAGILSPLDEVMAPFSSIGSPRSNTRSFFDTSHPLAGFDMESSIELPADIGLVNLPEVNIQYISDGPTLIATPTVLSQLHFTPANNQRPHQPIDNTEEEFQNAINDDLERNMASLQGYMPHHANVCEQPDRFGDDVSCERVNGREIPLSDIRGSVQVKYTPVPGTQGGLQAPGLEHLVIIPAVTVMDTPPPVMQDSMSSSTSSQVDLMSTSFTYPQNFDSWHYHSPTVDGLSMQGDLAPPPLEMIEVCKSVLVRSKPPSGRGKTGQKLLWEYPVILDTNKREDVKKKTERIKSVPSAQDNFSSERGEEILVLDNKPSLQKKTGGEPKSKVKSKQIGDVVDSDQGENSASEDDVFVDPSEVTPETSFYAAGSKYFKRRDFLSYGHFPAGVLGEGEGRDDQVFSFEMPPRTSLDESMLARYGEMAEHQAALDGDVSDIRGDLMDIGHESAEDIRFSKAHRSSKLLTLCERFEITQDRPDSGEIDKKKMITPPEKNIVSSIRQMHESLEIDNKDGEPTDAGQAQRTRKPSHDDDTGKTTELSVVICKTPTKDGAFGFGETSQKSPVGIPVASRSKDMHSPQGKPPRYKGKTRTPSESSLSETEGFKSTQVKSRTDVSPKLRYDGSPKGQRQSTLSSEEGSPKMLPHSGAAKGQRYSTEVSPKLSSRGKEGPPVLPKHGGSPTLPKTETGMSRIPVPRQNSFTKDDSKTDSNLSVSSSPKGARSSWGGVESSSAIKRNSDPGDSGSRSRIPTSDSSKADTLSKLPTPSAQKLREKSDKDKAEKKKRRGSIKELTNIFEEKIENLGKSSNGQSPSQVKLRSRVRSVSPNSAMNKSPTQLPNVRHSMEIPPAHRLDTGAGSRSSEGNIKMGSVRMGPKPFYGAK
ncbi:uncharacterized protein LOC128233978 isoform X2 [Mya arenaria]|uniref:uncharacterized protein LOC128233978 isoform X2 n=1 Tax=Mya arenaria TaxID=6604 RepID=UPI0022E2617A|nr:uncharacterized protein LOC128233978 isoform X2 [Mya arenaria]